MGGSQDAWIRVPVGDGAERWVTRGRLHTVLLVVHNVTSATRLLDVLGLFDGDERVQVLATCTGSSAFTAGLDEMFAAAGVPVLPWDQALATPVDLAVSASFGGELPGIPGKLAILSHGVGYAKKLATPDTGHRTPDTGRPAAGLAGAPVFGLDPAWLLHEGRPFADALVLSHPEQLDRLHTTCPEAAGTAVLAGDPCFDRILAHRPLRARYRRALGVGTGQRLILLNSTWGTGSLAGDEHDLLPALLPRLATELPLDEYRLAAVLHPNIWYGHGPGQVRAWLDRAVRAGLTLIDPVDGWRQALIAADTVIGDHGSVSFYAAALGIPVLLGAGPLDAIDPRSPSAAFVREAPMLDLHAPLRPQLDGLRPPPTGPAHCTTSMPGESAARLRRLFHALMGLPEPAHPATLRRLPLPSYEPAEPTAPQRVFVRITAPGQVTVTRYADPVDEPEGEGEVFTAVHEDTRDLGSLDQAGLVFRAGPADDPRLGPPARWTAEVLERLPHCGLAVYTDAPHSAVARTREGALLRIGAEAPDHTAAPTRSEPHDRADADPVAYGCALYAWLAAGKAVDDLVAHGLRVRLGTRSHAVSVARVSFAG
ncbi:hypothetical protein [Streptomyces indicus]|uniref:CDP-Glycerol:Poly(Glycerophosphate) glycerophosphotransferase n=1 Tax=Streptomyces indicus TaxID=417292 RepID=A0A1G9A6S7_9ACTN|nr:hypothetical protein [Streptomyces indicus]SDK22998.1 hypothetical protein SAMN05421806_105397 [Streptomyces indicus]